MTTVSIVKMFKSVVFRCLKNTNFVRYNRQKTGTIPYKFHKRGMKYIKNFTQDEKLKFLDSFDMIFCDCDGVIWQTFRDAIPGSAEAIEYLRQKGKQITFVTNNSITSTQDQLKKFQLCNIQVDQHDIVHPAQTVCNYLKSINFNGLIFCITSGQFKNHLREAGFQLVEEQDRIISESVHDLRAAIYTNDPVKAVIIDVDFNLSGAKLMRAHIHLRDPECLLIGGAADTLIPFGHADVIGPGPFISVVEKSAKRNAIILGKPGKELCKILCQRLNLQPRERALFIGDSLTSDVKFGKMCGFQTMVVLSGGTKDSDLYSADLHENEIPDYVADCLGDLNGLVL